MNPYRQILKYHPVGLIFHLVDRFPGQARCGQINGGYLFTQVEAYGLRTHDLKKGLRKNMLTRVLLHVVEATPPIEYLMHRSELHIADHKMANHTTHPLDIDNLDVSHQSMVCRLTPALRIEDRVGSDDPFPIVVLTDVDDFGLELGGVGVAVESRADHRRRV